MSDLMTGVRAMQASEDFDRRTWMYGWPEGFRHDKTPGDVYWFPWTKGCGCEVCNCSVCQDYCYHLSVEAFDD